jgi:hypothetical protein
MYSTTIIYALRANRFRGHTKKHGIHRVYDKRKHLMKNQRRSSELAAVIMVVTTTTITRKNFGHHPRNLSFSE